MNVMVSCEFRFFQTPNGKVWTPSSFQYEFWQRYLATFEHVTVLARVKQVQNAQDNWQLSNGKNVTFFNLPYYVGLLGFATSLFSLIRKLNKASNFQGMILCRVPSQTATILISLLRIKQTSYAVEVVGDPFDVFSSGVGGKLAKLLRSISTLALKKQCEHALGVSYVTAQYLQKRYPAGKNTYQSYYSSIMLDDSQIVTHPKTYKQPARKLLFVGSLNQLYKAPDILLAAFAKLVAHDLKYQLTLLGSGKYLPMLEQQANELNIAKNVHFVGEVNSAEVTSYLKHSDLFVLPSRTEGLPRAIIEAMAQALPCIGSTAGGIPELLPNKYCIEPDNVTALYKQLNNLSNDIKELTQQSELNLIKSKDYHCDLLTKKRSDFYQKLKELSL